ncbi:MAG TPA: hypothetical protein VKX46_18625, partial [Ktedonobacteraceae bacterium]|nr:hypothetical protein [Ktedonobacteraceae bacterium]
IAGDEAMVGIQAEHILRGEWPIYYYDQFYMGSLEAYLLALVFKLVGISIWTFRVSAVVVSLLLVVLTWRLAAVLAQAAQLSVQTKKRFVLIASLVAALPPLYDAVLELREMGGYIETFVLCLWLLLAVLRLTQRLKDHALTRELTLRWAGIGFLVGLGLWVDPLIAGAIVTSVVWLVGYVLWRFGQKGRQTLRTMFAPGLTALAALPAFLLGCAPALWWGLHHQWANVLYIIRNGGNVTESHQRLQGMAQVTRLYLTCQLPRVIGGAVPTEPDVTKADPHLLTFGLIVGGFCLLAALLGSLLILFRRRALRLLHLTGLPLLFAICTSVVFCVSSIALVGLRSGCGPWDFAGRYAVPLVVVLPYFIAAFFIIPALLKERQVHIETRINAEKKLSARRVRPGILHPHAVNIIAIVLNCILFTYLLAQSSLYILCNSDYTFQTPACVMAPTDNTPVIQYARQQHIHYAWATGWIGDPITFRTNGELLATEPKGRIKEDAEAVLHAERASFILLARHHGAQPPLLSWLQAQHITYRLIRFPAGAGFDIMVLTPVSRTVSPFEASPKEVFQVFFDGCY